jgi:rod shape determining protein RodA
VTLPERLARANWALVALALGLCLVGIVTISAASEDLPVDYGWVQVRWAVVGLVGALLVFAVPYRRIVSVRHVLYALGLVGLVVVLFTGARKGASRWISLGAFRMQPSEFMKVILVVALAGYVRYERSYKRFRGLALPFALTLVPVLLVMRQPDLGTAMLLVPILFVLLYAAGARLSHLGIVGLCGIGAGLLLYFVPGLLQSYQRDRIIGFLLQDADLSGPEAEVLRRTQGHQLHAAKTAVGVGGVFGADERDASVLERLPERRTDFVFPVLASRWGLAGASAVLLGYLAFLALLLSTALRVREPSGRMLVVGVFTLFAVQVVVNLGMTLGLLPIVGVPLPFLSYGGSSLLVSFLALGLVMNVGVDPPVEFGRGDFD